MGINKKGWCYQNQTIEEYEHWLSSSNLSKEQSWNAATQYNNFCNSFKNHLIPDTYSLQYIQDIHVGPVSDSFYVEFRSNEMYLLVDGKFFSPVLKSTAIHQPFTHKDVAITPQVEKFDWRIQALNIETALEYFEVANVFKNTRHYKFNDAAKDAAAEYYLHRCSMESNKIIERIGIDHISHIEIFYQHFNGKYCFKFHFKNPKVFYYFGYQYWDSSFGVW